MKLDQKSLEEAASLGSEQAAKSLYQMAGVDVKVSTSDVKVLHFSEVPQALDLEDKQSINVYNRLTGHVSGATFLILSQKNALTLADLLSGRILGSTRVLQDIDRSAVKEILNIISNSYVTSLVKTIVIFRAQVSPPEIITTSALGKKIELLLKSNNDQKKVVVFKTVLSLVDQNIEANLVLIFKKV